MLKCGGGWQDCPSEYGPSTTVYNRWNRWSHRGIWARILATSTEEGWIAETAQIDSSYIKAHRCAGGGKRGARANAIGISRGGRTTKVHALVDVLGRPLRLAPTPGNTSDIKGVELLADGQAASCATSQGKPTEPESSWQPAQASIIAVPANSGACS